MAERHGSQMALRTAPAMSGRRRTSRQGTHGSAMTWTEARNGMPAPRPYEWNGRDPERELSAIRAAAAARCGLSRYPAELIALSESLEDRLEHLHGAERKRVTRRYWRLLKAARREQAMSGGAA